MNDDKQLPLFDRLPQEVEPGAEKVGTQSQPSLYSQYIVYVDESGDHSLQSIDPQYPVFVLAFCIFHKRYYSETIVPALEKFKFNYFGHDQVVLHETEIRKEKGAFNIFSSREEKNRFIDDLTGIIEQSDFILISCTIDKQAIKSSGDTSSNPYHIALGFCMEALYAFLQEKKRRAES